jgi:hypothetical protein
MLAMLGTVVLVTIAQARPASALDPPCQAGETRRLFIKNECADPVWMVVTIPGTKQQVAVRDQWDWVTRAATKANILPVPLWGSMDQGAKTFTLRQVDDAQYDLVPGMKVSVPGAGDRAPLTATIVSPVPSRPFKVGDVVNLDTAAITSVTKQQLGWFQGNVAIPIAAGSQQSLCVPNKGAPSGNFKFYMGCPSFRADTDPFNGAGCVIGAAAGDAAGVDTLFEPTFGCMPPLSGKGCAFNPGDSAAACQQNPGPDTCGPLNNQDFFDISAVDGYTIPMRLEATERNCNFPSKDASMLDLASCPSETSATFFSDLASQQSLIDGGGIRLVTQTADGTYLKSCAAPYKWLASENTLGSPVNPSGSTRHTPDRSVCTAGHCFSFSYYAGAGCDPTCTGNSCLTCPAGSGPQQKVGPHQTGRLSVENTNFVQQLRAMGFTGYTWQFDDGIGGQVCDAGAQMTLTLCPAGGSPQPYRKDQLWKFSSTTGACAAGGFGAADGTTTFASLFACQKANMKFTCTDWTQNDPFLLPVEIWAADPAATRSPTARSRTYAEVQAEQQLVCGTYCGKDNVRVPNCTYLHPLGRHFPSKPDGGICPRGQPLPAHPLPDGGLCPSGPADAREMGGHGRTRTTAQ